MKSILVTIICKFAHYGYINGAIGAHLFTALSALTKDVKIPDNLSQYNWRKCSHLHSRLSPALSLQWYNGLMPPRLHSSMIKQMTVYAYTTHRRQLWMSGVYISMLNNCLEWGNRVYTPDSGLIDTYSTLADGRSCGLHCRSFGHARLHWCVIDTLSHCRQCGRHRQYECQHKTSSFNTHLFLSVDFSHQDIVDLVSHLCVA